MNIEELSSEVTSCRQCPRLIEWREEVASTKRRQFADEEYWGKPVPGFGDPDARVLIVGLAPAAHGANRTGRMFTGDRSGEWLYRALFRAGFANQADSTTRNDGLTLKNAYVTAIVRCAPPQNRPTPAERDACIPFFLRELTLLTEVQTLIALGSFAWEGALRSLSRVHGPFRPKPHFGHGEETSVGPYTMIGSYHPSQQNTFTGKLTEPMFDAVFSRARELMDEGCC